MQKKLPKLVRLYVCLLLSNFKFKKKNFGKDFYENVFQTCYFGQRRCHLILGAFFACRQVFKNFFEGISLNIAKYGDFPEFDSYISYTDCPTSTAKKSINSSFKPVLDVLLAICKHATAVK